MKSGGLCTHLETWITIKSEIIQPSLWEFKGNLRKKHNPCLSGELSNQQRRYRVSPDSAKTPLISFPNDWLLIVSVLHYCPERRKTSLGTVSTIIPHNSTDMQSSTHHPWKMCSFPWPAGGAGKCLCDEMQRLRLKTLLDKRENVKNVSSKEEKIGVTAPEWIGSRGLQSSSSALCFIFGVFSICRKKHYHLGWTLSTSWQIKLLQQLQMKGEEKWVCRIIFHAPVYSKIFNNGLKSDRAESHQLFWAPFSLAQLLREENLSD